jgi:hypothetical protein
VGGRDHYKCGSCNLSHCPKNTKLVYRARHGTCKGQSNGNAHPPLLVQARAQYPEPMDRAEFMHLPAMRRQWPEAKPGVKGIKKQSQNKNDQLGTEKELCKSTARKKKIQQFGTFLCFSHGCTRAKQMQPPCFHTPMLGHEDDNGRHPSESVSQTRLHFVPTLGHRSTMGVTLQHHSGTHNRTSCAHAWTRRGAECMLNESNSTALPG